MKTADYDFALPDELIAQQPLPDRAASRLMVIERQAGRVRHEQFRNLGRHLQTGDRLVLNDTKVIPARLWASDPPVELLLVENLGDNRWSAMVRPGRKAGPGRVLKFAESGLTATVEGGAAFGGRVLRFSGEVREHLERYGAAPLPPYIKRAVGEAVRDRERYQTVFAKYEGAIAAPTAGLHFTPELLATLAAAGIGHTFITLHVGIGTFRPVKTENLEEHPMHTEVYEVTEAAAQELAAARRIVAVGTTVARTLETVGEPRAAQGRTNLFIHPPFAFRMVGALLTNFHLPRSTLLMLVSAFAGRELIREAYAEAVRERYRFYSYGDCMLIV